jgi:DNA polymerase I
MLSQRDLLNVLNYEEIVLVDFEFYNPEGGHPIPVCLVAWELRSGRKLRLWRDELGPAPPYGTGEDTLFIAYYASAEINCHLALGWPKPRRILDLFTEFRNATNQITTVAGYGLLGALSFFGLDAIGVQEKAEMRDLILQGGPWDREQKSAILDYCESDVSALSRLLPVMLPRLDFPRATLRGRYMAAAAQIEHDGIPIDLHTLTLLKEKWETIQDRLIAEVDADYGIFDGRIFKLDKFNRWLASHDIPWPVLDTGRLDLSEKIFKEMADIYPVVTPIHVLRETLSKLRLNKLAVGPDGFNRCMLSAFRSKTGRNQPSNSRFVFGPSRWIRPLIKPPEGFGIAYIDWEQQEFGIAAALSGDENMKSAYQSGDPYLAFAKQAKAVPPEATKKTHRAIRDLYKQCVLGVQYGMEEHSLAKRIKQSPIAARELLRKHREIYSRFWEWSENRVDHAVLNGFILTVFGWKQWLTDFRYPINRRSISNFPMQANGAEMMRLAACLATESGIHVCCPVHDAFLIMSPVEYLKKDAKDMRTFMDEASKIILNGFTLRTDQDLYCYPERFMDEDGFPFWQRIMRLLNL